MFPIGQQIVDDLVRLRWLVGAIRVDAIAKVAQSPAMAAVRRRETVDQILQIFDGVDGAVVVAVIGFFMAAYRKPETQRLALPCPVHHRLRQARAFHRLRIAAIGGQPERRRERAYLPEHVRILPAQAECIERTQRPAEHGAALG
ncbi:hypothetical protein Y882_06625 [Dyella japonica DSM 16301]|uniref:Uncharacterized protein n=1 Tax=Dyella japonica DSM 16301 TaxID=1440762 RepID=A0A0G9H4W2_9GAMM|nr:hypothetical protein Y882_06625 [Dyella japonica DSM 16301]